MHIVRIEKIKIEESLNKFSSNNTWRFMQFTPISFTMLLPFISMDLALVEGLGA